jgi:NhaP-type Na+/H+ or K+/H+ antiporter
MGLLSGNVQSAVQSMDKEDVITVVFIIAILMSMLCGYVLGVYGA